MCVFLGKTYRFQRVSYQKIHVYICRVLLMHVRAHIYAYRHAKSRNTYPYAWSTSVRKRVSSKNIHRGTYNYVHTRLHYDTISTFICPLETGSGDETFFTLVYLYNIPSANMHTVTAIVM